MDNVVALGNEYGAGADYTTCVDAQAQSDGYLVIIQPKQVEVAEIQESLLSKVEYQQFRSIVAAADAAAVQEGDVVTTTVDAPMKQEGETAPLDQ